MTSRHIEALTTLTKSLCAILAAGLLLLLASLGGPKEEPEESQPEAVQTAGWWL